MNNKITKRSMETMKNILNNTQRKSSFEIDPLDINLAKIQFEFQKKIEHIPDYGDFAPLVEVFESKDPTRNISRIKVSCKHIKDETNKKRTLELSVNCKNTSESFLYTLANGNRQDMIEAVKEKKFFEVCKQVINKIDQSLT